MADNQVAASTPVADKSQASNNGSKSDSKNTNRNRDNSRYRRDRDRNNRSRRRSRSPVRSREDHGNIYNRVYVANIPFDVRWGELKDLFREKVGNVRFCKLFENEEGKPRGCGLVEFEDAESAKKAIDVLHRYELKGRHLVVKEDLDIERDRYGRLVLPNRRGDDRDRGERSHYDDYRNGSESVSNSYNTYGLSPEFLSSLGIKGPLNNRVFVANLDYKVSENKLEKVFALAGKVMKVKLHTDTDGNSKGFGIVEFEHPVEAVQAVSMFNNQKLYDRMLTVRLDKFDEEEGNDVAISKLPRGLEGIGKGLGIGGQPLNISKSMITSQPAITPIGGVAAGVPSATVPPNPTAPISALTNLAGNLPPLAQSIAQFSNSSAPGYSQPPADQIPPSNPMPSAYSGQYSGYSSGYSSMTPTGNGVPPPQPYSAPSMPQPASSQYCAPPVAQSAPYAAPMSSTSAPPPINYSTFDHQPDYERKPTIDTIMVRNLPLTFSWQNLRDRFNEVGEVRFAEIKGHGTALVRFASSRDAQRAVDLMNGIRIESRAIEVCLYY